MVLSASRASSEVKSTKYGRSLNSAFLIFKICNPIRMFALNCAGFLQPALWTICWQFRIRNEFAGIQARQFVSAADARNAGGGR